MLTFRTSITFAVMAFIVALAALLIALFRSGRNGGCRGLYRFHVAAKHRGKCLSALRACISRRKRPTAELGPRQPRIACLADRNSGGRWIGKIIAAWRGLRANRFPLVFNGLVDLGCATAIWYLSRFIGLVQAVGIIVGAYILAAGWRLLMEPVESAAPDSATRLLRRVQSDLGFQLVLQHGKLGDRDLSEIDGVAGRSVACQHD